MKISHNAEKLKVNEGPLEINVTLVMPWVNLKVISHVKRQPSNLRDDPEIGSVMGWPTRPLFCPFINVFPLLLNHPDAATNGLILY